MKNVEHIGIAVKNLEASNLLFEKLFGQSPYKEEAVASEGVKTSFFWSGPNKIELLEATHPDSPIAKFIEKKGEGITSVTVAQLLLQNQKHLHLRFYERIKFSSPI